MLTARYSHGFKGDEVAAINALPDLSVAGQEIQQATGTDDATAAPVRLAQRDGLRVTQVDSGGLSAASGNRHGRAPQPPKTSEFDTETVSIHDTGNAWRGGRVAEGTGLLNRRAGIACTAGSNPALSVFARQNRVVRVSGWVYD